MAQAGFSYKKGLKLLLFIMKKENLKEFVFKNNFSVNTLACKVINNQNEGIIYFQNFIKMTHFSVQNGNRENAKPKHQLSWITMYYLF